MEDKRSDRIERERDVNVLAATSYPLILVEKSVVEFRPSEAAIHGRYEKQHTGGTEQKVFPFELRNFW